MASVLMNKMPGMALCFALTLPAQATPPARSVGNVYVTKMTTPIFVREDLGVVRVLTLNLPAGDFHVTAKLFFGNGSTAVYQGAGCSLVSSTSATEIDRAYVRVDGGQVAMLPMVGAVSSSTPFSVSIDCVSDAIAGQVEMGRLVAVSVASITTL
jgi:hypothetical protein